MSFFRHLRWTLLWALLILLLCLIPGRDLPKWRWFDLFSLDKLVHAGVFAVLVVLMVRGLRSRSADLSLRSSAVIGGIALCITYGGTLEIMQGTLLTDRSMDLNDFIANAVGCVLGWWWLRRKERREAQHIT